MLVFLHLVRNERLSAKKDQNGLVSHFALRFLQRLQALIVCGCMSLLQSCQNT